MQRKHAMNFELTNRDETRGKKLQIKVFQQRSSGGVCTSCIHFCCGSTPFFINKENNTFYFKIWAIFNHFWDLFFNFLLRLKVLTKFIKECAIFKYTVCPWNTFMFIYRLTVCVMYYAAVLTVSLSMLWLIQMQIKTSKNIIYFQKKATLITFSWTETFWKNFTLDLISIDFFRQ